jgi:glycosyltransferase involved in cell wall biosynthesis
MINVLHLRDTDRVCGPGKTILETCCRIDKSRYNLSIGLLLLESETDNQYWEAAKKRSVQVVPVRSNSQYSPEIIDNIVKAVKDNNIHIIHSHEYKSDILAVLAARKIGVPIVTTAHGWITNSLKSKLYIWLGKQSFRFFERVIAVSPKIREEILRHGTRKDKVQLIYNAIVVEDYQPDDYEPGYLRNRFGIQPDTKIIGNVGRLSPEKGQAEFIRSAPQVLAGHDNVCFVLIGDGPDRQSLEKLVQELKLEKKIFFTGYESNVRPSYRDLDVLALTSFTEGFPNVLLEALCMQTPILATDVGGVADIVTDRETGVLVQPGDIDAIGAGLIDLVSDEEFARSTVLAGQAKIAQQFEFSQRVAKIEALYDDVMNG